MINLYILQFNNYYNRTIRKYETIEEYRRYVLEVIPNINNFDYDMAKETMDGGAVFEFALLEVPRSFKEFFKTFGGTIDDFDYCIFHQANLFMLEHIRKKIKCI